VLEKRERMKKDHRSGGKYSGGHTTVIPAAAFLADIADNQQEVTKISLGYIKAGLPSIEGKRRAKITERQGNLLVSVRDNITHQEITVYTDDPRKTKRALYRGGLKCGIEVSFVD
jgi:Predicted metal-binding protein (DUF2103)